MHAEYVPVSMSLETAGQVYQAAKNDLEPFGDILGYIIPETFAEFVDFNKKIFTINQFAEASRITHIDPRGYE